MRNSRAIFVLFTGLLIFFASCQDQKTYADRLKDEARAIDRFILQENIDVLEKFPADSIFRDNQYYRDAATGVYYHIVDYGDTDLKMTLGEEVYIRFEGLSYFMTADTITFSNTDPNGSPHPQTLIYRGPVNPSTSSYYETPGWIVPVPLIGHKAVVKMIVPLYMGSSYDRSQYQPTYYDRVEYRFGNQY